MKFKIKDFDQYNHVWRNRGAIPGQIDEDTGENARMQVKDALSTSNAPMWIPKVMVNMVKEAQEPLLVGTSLLTRIEAQPGVRITFPAVGALVAADIAEGQAYPEQQLSMGGATVTANVGKSGIAVKITEEMLMQSQYDLIAWHVRQAGRALARHKEQKIFNFITSMGAEVFNNRTPTTSLYGSTTGRNMQGSANGSMTMDDLFTMYTHILMQGFVPDTLLLHPRAWSMFVRDPVLRTMFLNGWGGVMFASHTGNPAGKAPWAGDPLGVGPGQKITPPGATSGATASGELEHSQVQSGAPVLPEYFPYPFRVIVSPFVPFDNGSELTHIMMFDSNELGALIVEHDVQMDEWMDHSVDITKMKFKERYGFGIFSEGQAIAIAKYVKVVPNEIALPARATIDVSASALAPLTASSSPL